MEEMVDQTTGIEEQQEPERSEVKTFTQEDFDKNINKAFAKLQSKFERKEAELEEKYKSRADESKKAEEEYFGMSKDAFEEEAYNAGMSVDAWKMIKENAETVRELKKKKESETKWQKNVEDFSEKYPDVDLAKLANNPAFLSFVKIAKDDISLAEKYEAFQVVQKGVDEKAAKHAENLAKRGTEPSDGSPAQPKTFKFKSAEDEKWAQKRVKNGVYKSMEEAYKQLYKK